MAEYLLVPATRYLIPLDSLDPGEAAPLSDAGLTSYHAVKRSVHLLGPGSTAVVIRPYVCRSRRSIGIDRGVAWTSGQHVPSRACAFYDCFLEAPVYGVSDSM